MAIVLTMADVTATQIIPGVYRSAAWVNTIVPADNLSAKLQPSTKYYVKWKFKKNTLPDSSHPFTQQVWSYLLLYNGSSSTAVSGSLSKANYEALPVGKVIQQYGEVTTPSDLTNYRLCWYTARYSGSSSDWGSNGQVIEGDLIDLEFSTTPFEEKQPDIYKTGIFEAFDFYETQVDNIATISKGNFVDANYFYEI